MPDELLLMMSNANLNYNDPNRTFETLLSYGLGAAWVTLNCIGYLAAPVNKLTELTGSQLKGGLLAASPVYFLMLLVCFFGGNSLRDVYRYLTSWEEKQSKIPLEFRLYPKTSLLLIAAFSAASANQLVYDNFNPPWRDYFYECHRDVDLSAEEDHPLLRQEVVTKKGCCSRLFNRFFSSKTPEKAAINRQILHL